ncbi:MAG: glycoside hydrolase family 2 protein [Eubacteriales bacterium]|nr:glycoside hydrolase family 2 protein [Eubacteriales bacterium]
MDRMTLNGQWRMREQSAEQWHDAMVPGSVYADYLRDGTIPDPFYRENEREAFELLRKNYEYCRDFVVTEEMLGAKHVLLHCDGLDTLAHVAINGQTVGFANNMHRSWEWEVKELFHVGDNRITVLFDSPIEYALAEYEKRPCWCSTDAIPGYSHLRKAHCMYGWDWGPRLPDAGIWRNIELRMVDEAQLDSVLVLQEHEEKRVTLRLRPEIAGNVERCQWTATVTGPDGMVYGTEAPVVGKSEAAIVIETPKLWWPAGYGSQPLYAVKVTLSADGKEQDVWEKRIGLRTMSVSREKDQWGEEFCHIVNGVKVFAMGGDYIPEDNLLSRVTPERTRRLLEDAKLAHFNTIRVWGGGYYPDDFFYDICDELGLMVWQDLMYACALYDLLPDFEANIRVETEQNVKRLRSHPSLAILCGNNEMEQFVQSAIITHVQGDMEAFGPKRHSHYADYIKMYEYILPAICKEHAPQTFWWPSSPSSGGNFEAPQDPSRGDVHYWDVWHGEKPFTEYRKFAFRYVSEFGFQSFPCLKTVESFTVPEDRNIFSRIMERHQRNKAANGKILAYLSQTYRYPNSFDDLLYASQLLQADAIRYGVEHWRRNRGCCMGAIIWQLNDCWPVASWSSIDYYGRWKALHYLAKRFFAPVMISAQEEGELTQNPQINEYHPAPIERSVRLNVANETREPVSGEVSWSLRTADGAVIRQGSQWLEVPALSSAWLDKLVFEEASITGHYVCFAFAVNGEVISSGTAVFCALKHFDFMDPQLSARVEKDEIVVSAHAFAKHVCVESEDADLLLSDNFFDMNPGEKRIRILRGSAKEVRLRSVYQLGRE